MRSRIFPALDQFAHLANQQHGIRLNRRTVLKGAGILGFGLSATLLAACEADDDDIEDLGAEETDDDDPEIGAEEDDDDPAEVDPDDEDEPTDDDTDDEVTDQQQGGSLNVALNADLTTMDPHMSTAAVDRQVYQNIFDKLVDINETLEIEPQLAEEWEISEDGTEYTFTLVEGVVFHDGEMLNADAVQFNFERMLDEEMGSPRRSEIQQVEDIEVVDEHTFQVTMEQAFSPFLATLSDRAGMMVSPAAVEELGEDLARQPVGTGPFQFVEWITDNRLAIERFDDYWQDGYPLLDEIIYRPITDASVRLTSLQTGEVHIIDAISARDINQAQDDPDLEFSEIDGLGFQYIQLNLAAEPFDEPALRQAIAYCIDREAITETLFFGTGSPAQTPIEPSSWAFDEDVQVYQQDYDRARELLDEAGMPDGFAFNMMVTNTPDAIQLAEAYQDQMAQVGIDCNLELLEFGTLLDRLNTEDFEACSLAWSGRPDPDGNIYGYFHSDGGTNRASYSNPDVDELLDQTRAVTDTDERREIYSEVTRLIAEDAPMIFVRFPAEIKVYQPAVQGFDHIPDGMMRFVNVSLDG